MITNSTTQKIVKTAVKLKHKEDCKLVYGDLRGIQFKIFEKGTKFRFSQCGCYLILA